jgi:hypothetical protein
MAMRNITTSACIAAIALVTASCDSSDGPLGTEASHAESQSHFEIWSSALDPIAHTGHAIAFDWESDEYLYWVASDVIREPHENYPKRGTFSIDKSGNIVLDAILDSQVTLKRIDIDGSEALSIAGRDFDQAMRAGLVLFNRKHGRIENPWSLAEPTEFEKIRTAAILKAKSKQPSTGQPATNSQSKAKDSDQTQP